MIVVDHVQGLLRGALMIQDVAILLSWWTRGRSNESCDVDTRRMAHPRRTESYMSGSYHRLVWHALKARLCGDVFEHVAGVYR